MLLLNAQNVKKSYGDKVILQFEKLAIYQGEKIGLVGYNGAGKSTLLQILAGNVEPEQGAIERQCEIAYYKQFDTSYVMNHDDEKEEYDIGMRSQGQVPAPVPDMASEGKLHRKLLKVDERYQQSVVSGGENTRLRLADTFAKVKHILLVDEPTTNLDMKGVELVKRRLMEVETLLIVSHDRELLDALCTRIIEVREGNLFFYNGNYSDYEEVRQRNMERQLLEYESYIGEKERLQNIFKAKMEKAKEVGRMPAKLSPKECRLRNFLSSRPSDAKERRMQEAAKAVKSRIDQLEVKQKPKEIPMIRINFLLTNPPENRFVMEGSNVSFSYGRRVIFKEASFRFQNGKHIAIIGDNGVGKTTLLNLITQNELGIRIVPKARLAYFRQDYSDLDLSATVIENVRKDSIQKEEVDRSVLARLLFSSDMLLKRAEVLSGGERIKLALAKLFVSNANVLILDEPTNFLDMPSIEALQRMLIDYEGTVIFVSHDRRFVKEVATQICILKDKKLQLYDGTFDEYLASESKKSNHVEATNSSKEILTERNREAYLLAAQMNLALLVGRFSDPKEDKEQLEVEYQAALLEMKRLSAPTHKSRGC